MEDKNEYVQNALQEFCKATKKPEIFLSAKENHAREVKSLLKRSYDYTKNIESKLIKSDALPQLIIQDFDLEQIWQQIELQNEGFLIRSVANVSKLVVRKDKLVFNELVNADIEDSDEAIEKDNHSESSSDDNDSDMELPLRPMIDGNESDELSLNDDDLSDDDMEENDGAEKPRKKQKRSIVDDKFFKLDEMEAFLNAEEKKVNDNEPDSGNDSESDDENEELNEDEEIDLFKDDSDDMENDETERGKSKNPKYNDFFRETTDEPKKVKRNKFMEENVSDEEMSEKNEVNIEENKEEVKSSLELRQERLKRKIGYMEEAKIAEKPWQLKGEITAVNRPQNSLLEEIVEFDLTTRPAPVITQETTLILEDVIRQRIKDKVFDSVERKQKPVDTPLEFKKKLVLNQEKSKESLAQIYEKDYLQQKEALDPDAADKEEEEPQLHKDIKGMMHGIFTKLDALSNFHFTPKSVVPDLKIVSNLPAIHLEEVAPVATSDAALLAPEEIKRKAKGDEIGLSERTDTDKKRQRRKKKEKQKVHASLKKKKEAAVGLGNKYSKDKAKKLLDQVTKDRNVDKMDETTGSKSVKSSTAFFTQLQEEVTSQIKNKTKTKNTKNTKSLNAKKMKL